MSLANQASNHAMQRTALRPDTFAKSDKELEAR